MAGRATWSRDSERRVSGFPSGRQASPGSKRVRQALRVRRSHARTGSATPAGIFSTRRPGQIKDIQVAHLRNRVFFFCSFFFFPFLQQKYFFSRCNIILQTLSKPYFVETLRFVRVSIALCLFEPHICNILQRYAGILSFYSAPKRRLLSIDPPVRLPVIAD